MGNGQLASSIFAVQSVQRPKYPPFCSKISILNLPVRKLRSSGLAEPKLAIKFELRFLNFYSPHRKNPRNSNPNLLFFLLPSISRTTRSILTNSSEKTKNRVLRTIGVFQNEFLDVGFFGMWNFGAKFSPKDSEVPIVRWKREEIGVQILKVSV